jgi:mannose-6-phosphate isomerase
VTREQLFDTSHFQLWRQSAATPFEVGAQDAARVLVCVDGEGAVEHDGQDYPLKRGGVMLLPASLGPCAFRPGGATTLLEIAIPDRL